VKKVTWICGEGKLRKGKSAGEILRVRSNVRADAGHLRICIAERPPSIVESKAHRTRWKHHVGGFVFFPGLRKRVAECDVTADLENEEQSDKFLHRVNSMLPYFKAKRRELLFFAALLEAGGASILGGIGWCKPSAAIFTAAV
jgi:hypothetical protein